MHAPTSSLGITGTDKDTGIQPEHLADLNIFWEATRALYLPYESDMKSTSADVYDHEMPGGQYTNLRIQVPFLLCFIQAYSSCCETSDQPSSQG